MLSINKKAPEFTLMDEDEKEHRLSDYYGKIVVLYFYPKDDTPGCTIEACELRDSYKKLEEAGAVILGISADSTASHKEFIKKYNLPFHLLSDTERKTIETYGAWQQKSMYGKKYMGIQRMTYILGKNGKIKKIFPNVTPKGHADEIMKSL